MSVLDKIRTIEKDGIIYYRLKDLHKLANCGRAKEPGGFLRQATDFIRNADSRFGINQTLKNFDTDYGSVYATELVCIRYAAYINPDFELDVYLDFLERHTLAESVSKYVRLKADALDAMCNKGNSMTITEASAEVSVLVGYPVSCQWLNNFLEEDHYKFTHWYSLKAPRKSTWKHDLVKRGYVHTTWRIDQQGNKQKQCRLTSRGVQYIAAWLNKHHAVFPRKQ